MTDKVIVDLWAAVQSAGPFASMILLAILYVVNSERKLYREKYDDLVNRFVSLAGDTASTLKDWRDILGDATKHGTK
jgi:hypothetical protein